MKKLTSIVTSLIRPLTFFIVVVSLCGATTNRDWQEANRQGTVKAYEQFLKAHPAANQATQARQSVAELRAELQTTGDEFEKRLLSWKKAHERKDIKWLFEYIIETRMPYSEVVTHLGDPIYKSISKVQKVISFKTFETVTLSANRCLYWVYPLEGKNSGSIVYEHWALFFDQSGMVLGYESGTCTNKDSGVGCHFRRVIL